MLTTIIATLSRWWNRTEATVEDIIHIGEIWVQDPRKIIKDLEKLIDEKTNIVEYQEAALQEARLLKYEAEQEIAKARDAIDKYRREYL